MASDDLSTKIAAAVRKHSHIYLHSDHFTDSEADEAAKAMADAVIRELGLRRENVELLHRWVTDWERPDYCNRCGIPHTTPCRREENR